MPNANNKDADQPAPLHSLIDIFVIHFLESKIPINDISKISRHYQASITQQARFDSYLVIYPVKQIRRVFGDNIEG